MSSIQIPTNQIPGKNSSLSFLVSACFSESDVSPSVRVREFSSRFHSPANQNVARFKSRKTDMLFAGPRSPAVPTVPVSGTGVTALSQNSIGALFVDVVAELEPKLASLLRRKLVMAQVVPDPAEAPLPSGREAAALRAQQSGVFSQLIQAAHDHGKNAAILRMAELDTKLIDVQWRARRSVSIRLLALAADNGADGVCDSFY